MYRSGDVLGIVIGIIIGAIIVFLICRELMCWYYKINRIVSLLEDQYRLLKMQMTFVPTHTVKSLTDVDGISLREKPSFEGYTVEKLPNGTKVQFLEKNSIEAEVNGIKGTWFKIMTQEKTEGWCFSGSLEKM
jgi:hypothetical protein